MERDLLLLGLLRHNEMYGYQINEFIDSHLGSGINLTRPTAYRLLHNMAEQGWITFREEKVGKRPTRRIYAITESGEAKFQEILLACFGDYKPAEYSSTVCIAFLDSLPSEVALPLLVKQRQSIEELLSRLKSDQNHPGAFQLTIDHQVRHLETDLEWLSELISNLQGSEWRKVETLDIHS
jgi:DNA-binding PadR family transcriptional regulator